MVFVMGQFLQLGINLACILSPGCAKMAPRLPNILHPSAKMSQDSPQEIQKHLEVVSMPPKMVQNISEIADSRKVETNKK